MYTDNIFVTNNDTLYNIIKNANILKVSNICIASYCILYSILYNAIDIFERVAGSIRGIIAKL